MHSSLKSAPVLPADDFFKEKFGESLKSFQATVSSPEFRAQVAVAAEALAQSVIQGHAIFAAGNGGSAADAQHFSAELVSKLGRDRTPIKSFAMTVDTSLLTAIGNDYGYEHSFSRQVEGLMKPGDILLAITTSGNSKNILKALEMCRAKGVKSVLLTGRTGGAAKALADFPICVPTDHTPMIQESHLMAYHWMCEWIERRMVEAGKCSYR